MMAACRHDVPRSRARAVGDPRRSDLVPTGTCASAWRQCARAAISTRWRLGGSPPITRPLASQRSEAEPFWAHLRALIDAAGLMAADLAAAVHDPRIVRKVATQDRSRSQQPPSARRCGLRGDGWQHLDRPSAAEYTSPYAARADCVTAAGRLLRAIQAMPCVEVEP